MPAVRYPFHPDISARSRNKTKPIDRNTVTVGGGAQLPCTDRLVSTVVLVGTADAKQKKKKLINYQNRKFLVPNTGHGETGEFLRDVFSNFNSVYVFLITIRRFARI